MVVLLSLTFAGGYEVGFGRGTDVQSFEDSKLPSAIADRFIHLAKQSAHNGPKAARRAQTTNSPSRHVSS